MLLKHAVLELIAAGDIDVVYRRWRRPTVKTGGQLRTAVGMLDIVSVDRVARRSITAAEAARAGYSTRAELLRELDSRPEGDLYRIEVRPGGPDPRVALRDAAELSPVEIAELRGRLERLDQSSKSGPWTVGVLRLLAENPRVRAQDLADTIGRDKASFKTDVRKLKSLGLTISHSPGYELSPRGLALLDELDA